MSEATPEQAFEVVGENLPRDEWLTLRRTGIGGSDHPAILGLSKYGNGLSVLSDKIATGDPGAEKEPRYRKLGHELEPVMLKLAAEERGALAWTHTPNTHFRSTLYPWAMCTMDGFLTESEDRKTWVEVKTGADAEEWQNGVPDAVYCQTQHQLLVTGADELVVALFFTGWAADYAITKVTRDEPYLSNVLVPSGEQFWWDHVVPKEEAGLEVDGNDYTRIALDLLHPTAEGDVWVEALEDDWLNKADELRALAERRKEIEDAEKSLKNEFRQKLAEGTKLLLSDGTYFSAIQIKEGQPTVRKAHVQFRGPYGGTK